MPSDAGSPIAALRESHDLLARLAAGLDAEGARRPSYCADWNIGQVASHLGSGAEIGLRWLEAAVAHIEPLAQEEFGPIWDKWNAREPFEQVTEAVPADATHVEALEELSGEQRDAARVTLFGSIELDGTGLALFRLPEHALHTWDIAVALDPAARVLPSAVDLLIDVVPGYMGWLGKAQTAESGRPWTLSVLTTGPERAFLLGSADAVTLTPAPADGANVDGVLRLPAEAFLRLLYGRLDGSNADGADLASDRVTHADLRATFPGI